MHGNSVLCASLNGNSVLCGTVVNDALNRVLAGPLNRGNYLGGALNYNSPGAGFSFKDLSDCNVLNGNSSDVLDGGYGSADGGYGSAHGGYGSAHGGCGFNDNDDEQMEMMICDDASFDNDVSFPPKGIYIYIYIYI